MTWLNLRGQRQKVKVTYEVGAYCGGIPTTACCDFMFTPTVIFNYDSRLQTKCCAGAFPLIRAVIILLNHQIGSFCLKMATLNFHLIHLMLILRVDFFK